MAERIDSEGGLLETVKTVVYALVIAGIFRSFLFQPFFIPSGSMKDTLLIGDFLFVNKMAYGYSTYSCPFAICPIPGRLFGSEPERGDVVVFRHPVNGQDYIKRLIGLPGDTVQIRNGRVFLNGQEQQQTPAEDFIETYELQGVSGRKPGTISSSYPQCANGAASIGGDCIKSRAIEELDGGVAHSVLNVADGERGDDTPVFAVPEGQYFFMGDNRDNSVDSRFAQPGGVGFVPYENLLGRADRVVFSSAGSRMLFFWTWRPERFFKRVD